MMFLPVSAAWPAASGATALRELTSPTKPPPSFKSFRVSQSFFSARAAAKLGVGRWVENDMKLTSIVVVYEAMLMSDQEEPAQTIDGEVWIGKYGAGIRIELSVQDMNDAMRVDAYSVALSVAAGMTKCGYEIKLLGGAMSPRLVLPPIGAYDIGTYESLLAAVDDTRRYMAENSAALVPVLTHVYGGAPPGVASLSEPQAVLCGVACLVERLAEQDAAARARKHALRVNAVRATYRALAPGLADTDRPSREHAHRAEQWWDRTSP